MVLPAMLLLLSTPACGSAAELAARVEELSGRSVVSLREEGIEYSTSISRNVRGDWSALLVLTGPSGKVERTVVAETCERAERAVALVIALRIEDELRAKIEATKRRRPQRRQPQRQRRQRSRAARCAPPDEPLAPRTARTTLFLRTGAAVRMGVQPELGATASAGIGITHEDLGRAMLIAGHQFAQRKQYAANDAVGADFEVEGIGSMNGSTATRTTPPFGLGPATVRIGMIG